MKQPAPNENPTEVPKSNPALSLGPEPVSFSKTNRRSVAGSSHGAYMWLLFASTAVAATFCLAYITKPVIMMEEPSPSATPPPLKEVAANAVLPPPATPVSEKILPDSASLPGEAALSPSAGTHAGSPPAATLTSDFEETNIRVQHILDAESPSGDINRIIVDVPVLYRSRNLRWSQAEAAEARSLLARLNEHQEKTRSLRDEGKMLLEDWNRLMGVSVPSDALRADSPSLPANQHDPLAPASPAVLDTIETIQVTEPEK